MKRIRVQIFPRLAISFLILVFPFYLGCSYCGEGNLFSPDLGFENRDQDNQFVEQQSDGSNAFLLTFSSFGLRLKTVVFMHSPYFFSQTPSFIQENLILRC